jgi:hypothetical protein
MVAQSRQVSYGRRLGHVNDRRWEGCKPAVETTATQAERHPASRLNGFAAALHAPRDDRSLDDGRIIEVSRQQAETEHLVVVGSMVAYTAYAWLLQNAPIFVTSTYAYVNPAVAVLLGAVILSEPVTGVVLIGGGLAVLGVALVVTAEPRRTAAPKPAVTPAPAAATDRA